MKNFIRYFTCLILVMFLSLPSKAIRIGLIDGVKETKIAVSHEGSIYDAQTRAELLRLTPMVSYTLKSGRNSIQVKINRKYYNLNSKNIIIKTHKKGGFCSAKNRWYRQELQVRKFSNTLTVINNINLELYLLGVVPAEMPPKWHLEAHKAQAIAARSYAIANRGKRSAKGYDLNDTPADQAYGGASSETKKTNQSVIDTQGQVLLKDNKVISAYYTASAGGKTLNSGRVWNKNLPYLHSVPSFDNNVPKSGHGVGMSQHGANNLANYGYSAYQILDYFYKDVQLGKVNTSKY